MDSDIINRALESEGQNVPREALNEAMNKIGELQANYQSLERYAAKRDDQLTKELEEKEKRNIRFEKSLEMLQAELDSKQQREQESYEQFKKIEARTREREHEQRQLLMALENERHAFNIERSEATENLNLQRQEFEEEKARYTQESKDKLEENTSEFVEEILSNLNNREIKLSRISFWSAIFGGVILIAGLLCLIYLSFRSDILAMGQMSWPQIVYFSAKGAVIAGVIGVISRYSYVFSTEYQKESLRVADKSHAIKFGQLYVETYGAAADWDRVKEAFSNWHGAAEKTEQRPLVHSKVEVEENSKQIKAALDLIKTIKSAIKE